MEKTVIMRPLVRPHLIDIDTCHPPGFRFERPDGDGAFLLMCFRTPAVIRTERDIERAEPGDVILHAPGFPLYHAACPGCAGGFRNDWVYLEQEVMETLLCDVPLPRNVLLRTGSPGVIAPFLQTVRSELNRNDEFSVRILENTVFDLLAAVRRSAKEFSRQEHDMTPSERACYAAFVRLREAMLSSPENNIPVCRLAAQVHLSAERFSVLYRRFFHATPHAELIDARLLKARRLLHTTELSQKEIADLCGWGDSHYFSRIFREKTGVTPTEFRRGAICY